MLPKLPKTFEGEGNPSSGQIVLPNAEAEIKIDPKTDVMVILSEAEQEVLRKVLDRDRTSKLVHGGLKSLLTLTDDETDVLIALLKRI